MRNIFGKEFLMGIGVGCIISAMIISLFSGLVITDEEVIARASKLGMVRQLPWNDDQKAQGAKFPKQSPNSNKSSGQEASKASSLNNNKKNEVPDNKENVVKNNAQMSKTVSITITSRMGSEAVARELEAKGAIKDQHEFLRGVEDNHAQSRLQTGTFTVPVNGDLEEILKTLTGRK